MPVRWDLHLPGALLRFLVKVVLPMAMTNAFAVWCILAIERGSILSQSVNLVIDPKATYTIVATQSGKCVSVAKASTQSSAPLEIATCNGGAHQQFRAQPMDHGFFRLQNVKSGLCADVSGASMDSGAKVIQYGCGNDKNQQWSFTDVANGIQRITSRHSGRVLDVTGQGSADGTPLEQWTSNDGANQEFSLEVVAKSSATPAPSTRSPSPPARH